MTKIRHDDTSALPAAAREPDGHTHPMPRYVSVCLLIFAVLLALTLAGLLWLSLHQDAQIQAELDRRTAARNVEQQRIEDEQTARDERTRVAVCTLLVSGDLGDSPRIADLATELSCR